MAISVEQLVRELRGFDQRREIVKALSKAVRAGAPKVRKKIRAAAMETLPKEGGLNAWVAASKITIRVKLSGRSAGITLRGGRNSKGGRSDLNAIDRGRVRAPTWGHRQKGAWHTVIVTPGFFTQTAAEATEWHDEVDKAVDAALEQLRRG